VTVFGLDSSGYSEPGAQVLFGHQSDSEHPPVHACGQEAVERRSNKILQGVTSRGVQLRPEIQSLVRTILRIRADEQKSPAVSSSSAVRGREFTEELPDLPLLVGASDSAELSASFQLCPFSGFFHRRLVPAGCPVRWPSCLVLDRQQVLFLTRPLPRKRAAFQSKHEPMPSRRGTTSFLSGIFLFMDMTLDFAAWLDEA
jgi:hypothetical protein